MDRDNKKLYAYKATPRNEPRGKELTRWRRFLRIVVPWLADKDEMSERYFRAKVEKMEAESQRAANEAARVAAEVDRERQESVGKFVDIVDANFAPEDSTAATELKLAKLLEANPEIEEQIQKIRAIARTHGIRIKSRD